MLRFQKSKIRIQKFMDVRVLMPKRTTTVSKNESFKISVSDDEFGWIRLFQSIWKQWPKHTFVPFATLLSILIIQLRGVKNWATLHRRVKYRCKDSSSESSESSQSNSSTEVPHALIETIKIQINVCICLTNIVALVCFVKGKTNLIVIDHLGIVTKCCF